MKESNFLRRKSDFISRYKSKLNYLYGNVDRVLKQCNHNTFHNEPREIIHNLPKIALRFDTSLLSHEANNKLKTIDNYITTLSKCK